MKLCSKSKYGFYVYLFRDVHGISTTRDRMKAATMIILAVATSTIAICTNVYSMFGSKS